jgi:hypothetical protein
MYEPVSMGMMRPTAISSPVFVEQLTGAPPPALNGTVVFADLA